MRSPGGRYDERLDGAAPGEIGDLATPSTPWPPRWREEQRSVALLADVSHEFRTPLNNLRGYLEGIEDGIFAAMRATVLPACRRQIQRLERLCHDLSLLSRVDSGTVDLHLDRVDARDIVAASAAAFRPAFRDRGVELIVYLPAEEACAEADAERCEQALANLLANALRFTPRAVPSPSR